MDSNTDKKENKDSKISDNSLATDKISPPENTLQKSEQTDLKKLITKIDNRVKTKVFLLSASVKKSSH